MKQILLTGFEPFANETINPSWELVKTFNNEKFGEYWVISRKLPTVFYDSIDTLKQYINENNPDIIICFGQAEGSNTITLEKVAINYNDARIPDNKNQQPIDECILENGKVAYFSTLPLKKIKTNLELNQIPCSISLSAGAYVCNHVFYNLMNLTENTNILGGFIHIPYINEQVKDKQDVFSLDIQTLKNALTIILHTLSN